MSAKLNFFKGLPLIAWIVICLVIILAIIGIIGRFARNKVKA